MEHVLYYAKNKKSKSYFSSKHDIHWNQFLQRLQYSDAQLLIRLACFQHVLCVQN